MMSSSDSSPSATGHDGLPDFDAAHRLFTAVEENDTNDPSNSGAGGEGGGEGFPQIAGYVIDRLLGAGGGGTVYRAVRAGSEHTVAIKLLNRRLGAGHGAPEAQRAWRELHLLSQLRLPCLPHVHDYDEHEGRLYIVTDYVDGLPLAEYCEEHALDREARGKLLAAVADCVQTLHEHGVIHRDIKPANIIINPHGQPIIIDLGIAALLTDDVMDTLTAEGAPIGSPAFMAPEQARGDRNTISTRRDVYSLGATAYYILTGEPPHDMTATIHEAVRRVAQDPPRDPRELDRTLPKPLASVLWKAVAPKPADRYASAAGFAADLRHWLNREPVEAGGLTLAHRIGRLIAHHPITTTAAACTTIALLVFAATYVSVWYLNARPHHMELTPDGREARLMSVRNNILNTWRAEAKDGIRFAQLVERPAELGRGQIALVAFNSNVEIEHAGALCAFSLGDFERPIWSRRITNEDLLPEHVEHKYKTEGFGIAWVEVQDVFPKRPGLEVIANYQHAPGSACAIRVYDMSGEVLYQIWHDGSLGSGYWMVGPRLLVLCGLNSEVPWPKRAHEGAKNVKTGTPPIVLLAVKPRAGHIAAAGTTNSPGGDTATLSWYRCLLPAAASDFFTAGIVSKPFPEDGHRRRFVRLYVKLRGEMDAGFSWLVDDQGNVVSDAVSATDAYRLLQSRGQAPNPDNFHLGDLPPVVSR